MTMIFQCPQGLTGSPVAMINTEIFIRQTSLLKSQT